MWKLGSRFEVLRNSHTNGQIKYKVPRPYDYLNNYKVIKLSLKFFSQD